MEITYDPLLNAVRKKDSGGGLTEVDSALSSSSTNPVQNKVVTGALEDKADLVNGKVPSAQLPSMDYVPTTRTVNSKVLSSDITLTAGDVGASPKPVVFTPAGEAPTTSTVGTPGRRAVNTADGKAWTCIGSTTENDVTTYIWREDIMDVQVNSSSVLSNGVANIPYITENRFGVAKANSALGIGTNGGGSLRVENATTSDINSRTSQRKPIVPITLDYAVRSVLPNITVIPAATTSYSLLDASATTNDHSWQYFHAPDAATTYTFPAVTDTSVAHRIKLILDFTTVQTYAFVDSQGNAIEPLFTPTIAAGDVYEFRCEYSAVQSKWLIYPCKQGAVSDDYVMQAEVGAANGVAPLDSSSLVPVANLPVAGKSKRGVVKALTYHEPGIESYGVRQDGDGILKIITATNALIDARTTNFMPIVPNNLNYAVTAALTDANHITLTSAQQATAQSVLGISSTGGLTAAQAKRIALIYG